MENMATVVSLKRVKSAFDKLNRRESEIKEIISKHGSVQDVQPLYKQWLDLYEDFLEKHESHTERLSEKERDEYIVDFFNTASAYLQNAKTDFEKWFSISFRESQSSRHPRYSHSRHSFRHSLRQQDTSRHSHSSRHSDDSRSKHSSRHSSKHSDDSHSTHSSRHTSRHSSIQSISSSMKLKEIELEVKARTLDQRQKIEEEKLRLKQEKLRLKHEKEKLDVHTKLEIVGNQRRVLEKDMLYERPDSPILAGPQQTNITSQPRQSTAQENIALPRNIKRQSPIYPVIQGDNSVETTCLQEIVKQLKRPVCDIQTFEGDVLTFRKFIRQFNNLVLHNTTSDEEKITYLEQYTKGEANSIVLSFINLSADVAYRKTMEELEKRYGDSEFIANSCLNKLFDRPIIRSDDPKALDSYSIDLTQCLYAVRQVERESILNYPENIKRIVQKLPFYIHDKWRNIVQKAKDENQSANFEGLVKLVNSESKKANDPVYGRRALVNDKPDKFKSSHTSKSKSLTRRPKASFSSGMTRSSSQSTSNRNSNLSNSSHADTVTYACKYCSTNQHKLNACNKFKALTHEEKVKFIRDNRICFGCLTEGHMKRYCVKRETCSICNQQHPTLLHYETEKKDKVETKQKTVASTSTSSHKEAGEGQCTFVIVPVRVKMKDGCKCIYTYAFLDSGSSCCFCTNDIMKEICGEGKRRKITVHTMGKSHSYYTHEIEGIEIYGLDNDEGISLPTVYTTDEIPVSKQFIPTNKDISNWKHFDGITLPDLDCDIGLLIGNNVPNAFSPIDIRRGPPSSPHATKSRIGWLIWNLVRDKTDLPSSPIDSVNNTTEVVLREEIEQKSELENLVRKSMQLDFPERIINDRRENSQEDKLFLKKVQDSIEYQDGHYVISLPFRNNTKLPDNLIQAENRLKTLKRKLENNEDFRIEYNQFMENLIAKGFAEIVPEEEIDRNDSQVWYLPHFAAFHPRKKSIRIVFDCAAKFGGISLNDMILQGQDLTNTLIGVLIRFRQGRIAVISDIESMFHQVVVPKQDRDYLRFLWWSDGDLNQQPSTYRMVRHLFGSTSSPSCANMALRRTAHDNATEFDSEVIQTLLRSFYVDDCLKSLDDTTQMIQLVKDLILLCQKGGFRLTKWLSNSIEVLNSIPETERSKGVKNLNLGTDTLPDERALGVFWSVESDTLEYRINLKDKPATRRGILSTVASIYDPLGLASPFILQAKLILQAMCQKGQGWDDEISGIDMKKWTSWLNNLPDLEHLAIPRCYKVGINSTISEYSLHCFSDASDLAYGVIIYLRITDELGNIKCTPVIAKSRVAPLKKISIPRMELTAAMVAVKLCSKVKEELDIEIESEHFWTDSMSVLRYVRNESARFKTFVANRIQVIRDGSDVSQWKYVETKLNPADYASRTLSMQETEKVNTWLNGPQFLRKPEQYWPTEPSCNQQNDLEDIEIKKTVSTISANANVEFKTLDNIIDHYSQWYRLKKAIAYLTLFVEFLKQKREKQKPEKQNFQINCDLLQKAETCIIKYVQKCSYNDEIVALSKDQSVKKSSSLIKLDPILVDGVLRVGGRLSRSNLPFSAKHQAIMPKQSNATKLIIREIHARTGHSGKNMLLAESREKFWIPSASSLLREITRNCVSCRKYKAKVCEQKMADLPFNRVVTGEAPFTQVGVDFFGPFMVSRGRSEVKRYGVVFTCLVIRAVHIEVAASLSTDSCVNAIRRFIARRGPVKLIQSDNGTNLVGANREMKEEIQRWNENQIKNKLLQHGIDWRFNPPSGSHFGGVWERLIRSIRKILYSLLHERLVKLDDESLSTLFCEVEAVLNSRPLTAVSSDKDDLQPLTPNSLLLCKDSKHFPPGLFCKNDNFATRRWRQVQYLADIFWKRFVKEYLPLMQIRSKWNTPRRNVAINDIVVVLDSAIRSSYILGRVINVIPDKKGFVRIVDIRTKTTTLQRPVDKICVILESDA